MEDEIRARIEELKAELTKAVEAAAQRDGTCVILQNRIDELERLSSNITSKDA